MPNGLIDSFGIDVPALRQLVAQFASDTPIAWIVRKLAPEYAPLSAAGLAGLLRDDASDDVVITEESPSEYAIRLIPPVIFVSSESPLFARIDKRHPGGLCLFAKERAVRLTASLPAETVVGKLLVKRGTERHESLSAEGLSQLLNEYNRRSLPIMEDDTLGYTLTLNPREEMLRWVAVPADSPLTPLLRRVQAEQKRRDHP